MKSGIKGRSSMLRTLLLIAITAPLACDREPAPIPPTPAEAQQVQESESSINLKPTTQEMLTGPRTTLRLSYFPLSVQAPPGWRLTSMVNGELTFIEGPAPAGDDVQIQLSHRGIVSDEQFSRRHAATTREASSASVLRSELRTVGAMEILEHQSLGKEPVTLHDRNGDPLPETVNFKWNVHVFIHRSAGGYESYELNFVGLTADQYEKDKDFLRGIIDSLKHDPHPAMSDLTESPSSSTTQPQGQIEK